MDLEKATTTAMDTAVDSAVTSAATKAMGSGATTTVLGWATSNDGIAAIGLGLTIVGFIVNLIFQARRDYREQALHAAKLAVLSREDKD